MPPGIRLADAADAPALARLRWEFRASLDAPNEDAAAFLERCERWMRERLTDGAAWRAWVAVDATGELLGTVWIGRIEKMPNPLDEAESHAYVTNFYVRDAARGAGIGTRLLEAALAWCEAERVHAAILWPTRRTMPLYARYGFASPDALMERTFGPGPSRG